MQLISIPPLFNLNTDNQLNFMDKIIIDLSDIHYRQGWEVHVKKKITSLQKNSFHLYDV